MTNETELTMHRAGAEAELEQARLAIENNESDLFLVHLDRVLDHLASLTEVLH